ncbi:hypothetical protein GRF59_24710 [Paenibacillus sp. HJL G12]|uniref:DUF6199 domain-containing protein n=1 Tax=Paenibacillus dendrobii TaxID=2691084 RepID=A0A7X3IQ21_9BACL|nr:DUF6199 family natural product biosynthesis protein [Paenibacillus dendrobii]MWV46815.1 hypothetical protein [Paenibacillus dendrobii]
MVVIIFLGVVALAFGLMRIYKPSFGWRHHDSWKVGSESEPSESYVVWAQIGGIFTTVLGVFLILVGMLRTFF